MLRNACGWTISHLGDGDEAQYLNTCSDVADYGEDPFGRTWCRSADDLGKSEFRLMAAGYNRNVLDEVATARVPATTPKASCSRMTAYIPALTIGMAQQQYSLGFMVVGSQVPVLLPSGNRPPEAVLE